MTRRQALAHVRRQCVAELERMIRHSQPGAYPTWRKFRAAWAQSERTIYLKGEVVIAVARPPKKKGRGR